MYIALVLFSVFLSKHYFFYIFAHYLKIEKVKKYVEIDLSRCLKPEMHL